MFSSRLSGSAYLITKAVCIAVTMASVAWGVYCIQRNIMQRPMPFISAGGIRCFYGWPATWLVITKHPQRKPEVDKIGLAYNITVAFVPFLLACCLLWLQTRFCNHWRCHSE